MFKAEPTAVIGRSNSSENKKKCSLFAAFSSLPFGFNKNPPECIDGSFHCLHLFLNFYIILVFNG